MPEAKAYEKRFVEAFDIRYDQVVFGNTLFKQTKAGQSRRCRTGRGWRRSGRGASASATSTTTGSRTCSSRPAWLPVRVLAQRPHDEQRRRDLHRPGEAGWHRTAAGGYFLPEAIGGQSAARGSRAAAVADFTNSGQLDLVVNNFNDRPYFSATTSRRRTTSSSG